MCASLTCAGSQTILHMLSSQIRKILVGHDQPGINLTQISNDVECEVLRRVNKRGHINDGRRKADLHCTIVPDPRPFHHSGPAHETFASIDRQIPG